MQQINKMNCASYNEIAEKKKRTKKKRIRRYNIAMRIKHGKCDLRSISRKK